MTGPDDPEGIGYYRLQQYCGRLTSLGVLLAAASKNSPEVKSIFEDNPNVALTGDDFSSMQISWDPKSRSIARISAELGFGAEFMLFVEDNPFEPAEALGRHPDLDVILAGPEPAATLPALSAGPHFHPARSPDTALSRPAPRDPPRGAPPRLQQPLDPLAANPVGPHSLARDGGTAMSVVMQVIQQ